MKTSQLNQQSRKNSSIAESTSPRPRQILSTPPSSHISPENRGMLPMLLSTLDPTWPQSEHILPLQLIQDLLSGLNHVNQTATVVYYVFIPDMPDFSHFKASPPQFTWLDMDQESPKSTEPRKEKLNTLKHQSEKQTKCFCRSSNVSYQLCAKKRCNKDKCVKSCLSATITVLSTDRKRSKHQQH